MSLSNKPAFQNSKKLASLGDQQAPDGTSLTLPPADGGCESDSQDGLARTTSTPGLAFSSTVISTVFGNPSSLHPRPIENSSQHYLAEASSAKQLLVDFTAEGVVVKSADAMEANLRRENDLLRREMALMVQEHALARRESSEERARLLDDNNRLQAAAEEVRVHVGLGVRVVTLDGFLELAIDENGATSSQVVPLLVDLLDSPAPPIQLWALESLAQLLESEPYRKPAHQANCLSPLISLLNSPSPNTIHLTLSSIHELCKSEQAFSKQLCRSAAIRTIVDLLLSPLVGVQEKAVAVLYEVMGWRFGMTLLGGIGVLPAIHNFVASDSSANVQHLQRMRDQLASVYTA